MHPSYLSHAWLITTQVFSVAVVHAWWKVHVTTTHRVAIINNHAMPCNTNSLSNVEINLIWGRMHIMKKTVLAYATTNISTAPSHNDRQRCIHSLYSTTCKDSVHNPVIYTISGVYEPPRGGEGASNYVTGVLGEVYLHL